MPSKTGRKHVPVTGRLLWQAYRQRHPDRSSHRQASDTDRCWSQTQDLLLWLEHAPGDRCFLDQAGMRMSLLDRHPGEIRSARIVIATLGRSGCTCLETT